MWKQLSLDDKETIESYTKGKFVTSDYSFVNLYLWSKGEQIEFNTDDDVLIIRGIFEGQRYYFVPVPKSEDPDILKKAIEKLKILVDEKNMIVKANEYLRNLFSEYFEFKEIRNYFDYLYSIEELSLLSGRKFSKKKNRINNFKKNYNFAYETINSENIKDVIDFQDNWCEEKGCSALEVLVNEHIGILNVLNNFDKLPVIGCVLKVSEKIIGFSLAEIINDDYILIHTEKALSDYIGSYQILNQLFLQNEFKNYKYVNREEDGGDEGLRIAKESYHPIELIKKYNIISYIYQEEQCT